MIVIGKKFNGHMHVHTEYSTLDGLAKIEELILRAKELGQTAIAITDHGASSGVFEAFRLGKKHNFNVLFGEEFYFENTCEELKTGHLILIAKNEEGLKNIFKLQQKAYTNMYYKPRINIAMLKEHSSGLVCCTACIANAIGQFILRDEPHLAVNEILELEKIFGEDLYVEIQSSSSDDVIKVNKALVDICKNYNFKPIVTNDVHYVEKKDFDVHEVLLCIQQKGKMNSQKRWKFEHNDYWLKTQEELEAYLKYIDRSFIEKCYESIDEVIEKCSGVEIKGGDYLPNFKQTKKEEDEELYELTMSNYLTRIKERGEQNEDFLNDLYKELDVIKETGYSGYFLIVQEYINWAKQNGILVGDGRGSGAGSKVAYTLGITEVNPQKYDLLFERFLCPGRSPDFDVDFSDIDAVFKHLQEKYGEENVVRVGAFSRFTAKSAIRKVMGVYGFSQSEISQVTKMLPQELTFTFDTALERSKELREWFERHENLKYIVYKLEGLIEHMSTHAGGVLICEGVYEILPTFCTADDKTKFIAALDKKEVEALGHYKFDILGLSSLILMKNVTEYTPEINWSEVNFDDANVYKAICSGDVLGIFQLADQADKVVQQQPKNFEDLIAINALIRPGVCDWNEYMKARRGEVQNELAKLSFMKCTHGLIVYQDQYLQLANYFAGWDIAFADNNIRKNKHILEDVSLREKFVEDCEKKGILLNKEADELWNTICKIVAGGYGFNRAHSTSYARLSFQTAYLKLYYPEAFYAGYMTQNFDDSTKIAEAINVLRKNDIKIVPPDINKSCDKFIPTEDGILFPLNAIKGVGGSALYEIERLKPIESLNDFLKRRVPKFVKSTVIEALIKAGAFDFEGKGRFELLEEYKEGAFEKHANHVYEKEALNYYLSETPFEKYTITPVAEQNADNIVTIVEVASCDVRYDKRGQEMAFAVGVNNHETIRLILFSSVWKSNKISQNDIIIVRGRLDNNSILVRSTEVVKDE